ncbi:SpvB domain-containing protein, partial [Pyrenochaeta sp. DS3sAY3a]
MSSKRQARPTNATSSSAPSQAETPQRKGHGGSVSGAKESTTQEKQQIPKAPSISLPKGGGAIRDIGEKFTANPATGTASLSVPIAASPARSGVGPQLSISYSSGQGNGPFGLGWQLSLPAITRKTDKGLPRYQDSEDSDVFIFSGAEDLVPLFKRDSNGQLVKGGTEKPLYDEIAREGYTIRHYRPRIEGLFARIERWTRDLDGDVHWRAISRENITTVYGQDSNSRIACPTDSPEAGAARVFSWLISQTYDSKGNASIYKYKKEDSGNVPVWLPNEMNRTDQSRSANHYLKSVQYGNRVPNRNQSWKPTDAFSLPHETWMFNLVFDYGEHDFDNPSPTEEQLWSCRKDPISSYRSGFEVRTYRLCQRALMFHSFPDVLGPEDRLIQETAFTYDQGQVLSVMTRVTKSGYSLQPDRSGKYLKKSLPPLDLEYSKPPTSEQLSQLAIQTFEPEDLENVPFGVDGSTYTWVDLNCEGTSGIFTEQADCWLYKKNTSASNRVVEDGIEKSIARFGPLERLMENPPSGAGPPQFLDLAGSGHLDVVLMESVSKGFYKRTKESRWEEFRVFASWPNIDTKNSNLKFVDLNGDGLADILVIENDVFTWYPSLGEDGYDAGVVVSQQIDNDEGPRLVFADAEGALYLADFSGDGLSDLVRIRNGEVAYWPNLGYGCFGSKVVMDNAPYFDHPEQFSQSRIRIADIDGSGPSDIIYLGRETVDLYRNQSGNGWSDADHLEGCPPANPLTSVATTDLFGAGTTCIVWSSSLPTDGRQQMHYLDLMDGRKPHLLTRYLNNMGAETRLRYMPSTYFYEKDLEEGRPWVTRLSFPVQCVRQVDIFDHIARNHFASRYAYHHGFFDGTEREFHGFGMVEQWDTEVFGSLQTQSTSWEPSNENETSNVPPVYTKTWFHTGAFFDQDAISHHMAGEYFGSPTGDGAFKETLLEDTILPPVELTPDEMREASRALKGHVLRKEVYAKDGSPKEGIPYNISESNHTIELLQPRENNPYAIFFSHPRESIEYDYDRKLDDPRIGHNIILQTDEYGNVLRSVSISYGRQPGKSPLQGKDKAIQEQRVLTYMEDDFTNAVNEIDDYCAPIGFESRDYEISGVPLPQGVSRFSLETFAADDFAILRSLTEIPYEQQIDHSSLQKRLLNRNRSLYRSNDLSRLLPVGHIETMMLPGVDYKLALTPGILSTVYQRTNEDSSRENLIPTPADILGGNREDQAAMVDLENDGNWWVPSGRIYFHPDANASPQQELDEARAGFFLERRFVDPFGHTVTVEYDLNRLLLVRTQDAVGSSISAVNDYRMLEPAVVTDINGNRSMAAYDALGFVAGTAVMGKPTETLGDNMDGFEPDLSADDMRKFFSRPRDPALLARLLGNATSRIIYDATRYWLEPDPQKRMPIYAATLHRETHTSDSLPPGGLKIQVSFAYSDGFGRDVQQKVQAEAGPVDGVPGTVNTRWTGTGWTVFNNKGKTVRQYEPFFDDTHEFRFNVLRGVSPVIFYDAVERSVATLHPGHSWEKVVFDPWQQISYDQNDTVLMDPLSDPDVGYYFKKLPQAEVRPTWYEARINNQMGPKETSAAKKAAAHANTPGVAHADVQGRTFLTIVDNGPDGKYESRSRLDIEGHQREVIDARGRVVMRYDYDMLKGLIHQASMEAGELWTLNNAAGKVFLSWNSRRFRTRTQYDGLHRQVAIYVQGASGAEKQVERYVYGETLPGSEIHNQRGKVVNVFDQAGVVLNGAYDFKGNLLTSQRQFAREYKETLDWSANVELEASTYANQSQYDGLDRVIRLTAPDNSITGLVYSDANMPDRIEVNIKGESIAGDLVFQSFISNIDYNEKGQRTRIDYGNSVTTTFSYDAQSFNVVDMQTRRSGEALQSLHYTYDPVGNITSVDDSAQQTVFFRNRRIEPSTEYTYDAVYRLISATGREHLGMNSSGQLNGPTAPDAWNSFHTRLVHLGDGNALGNYTETYIYDSVDNILSMKHNSSDPSKPGWTRRYAYNEKSQLEPMKQSNRLSSTTVGTSSEIYTYGGSAGVHGMMSLPHLSAMEWDYKDQLHSTARQSVNSGTPETTIYVYDVSGQRTRKVTERFAESGSQPTRLKERLYLGVFEIYREFAGDGNEITLERETLNIMDGGNRIAMVESRTQGEDASPQQLIRYQFSNFLGTALLELDSEAQIISYEEYYPFGSTSYQAVRSETETPKRYR